MKFKRLITFILIFTIMLNFAFVPRSESVALTLGVLYGVSVGEALLAFILSSVAVGVTYATLEDAKKAYDLQEAIKFEEFMMMPPIDPRPPEEQGEDPDPPKGWRDVNNKLLKGGGLAGLGLIFWNLKEWYQGLGAEEGENIYIDNIGLSGIYNEKKYNIKYEISPYSTDGRTQLLIFFQLEGYKYDPVGHKVISKGQKFSNISIEFDGWNGPVGKNYSIKGKYHYTVSSNSKSTDYTEDLGIYNALYIDTTPFDPITNKIINYDVNNNSTIITNNLPQVLQQPNITVIPADRFETTILPNGTTQKVYKGSQEQMLQDIVNNTTIENVYNNTQDYTIINQGDTVIINEGSSITPYPTPTPGETPSTPVEPGTQLDYTSWFQQIINWLSNIFNEIKNIPSKILEGLSTLFIPQDNYLSSKMDNINNVINGKLGQPDGTPLLGAFSLIDCEYIENQEATISLPGGISSSVDLVNTDNVNNMATTIREWQRFLWWVTIVLISMNNIYKLVRGTDLITIKGPEGTGWGSAGRKSRGGG